MATKGLILSEMPENPRRKTERGFSEKTLWDRELAATRICARVPPVDLGAKKTGENLPEGPGDGPSRKKAGPQKAAKSKNP